MKTLSLKEMKKVAAMFVAVACISISALGAMQEKKMDTTQASIGCWYMSGSSEGGAAGAWGAAGTLLGASALEIAKGSTFFGWNPVGWVGYAVAGACAL